MNEELGAITRKCSEFFIMGMSITRVKIKRMEKATMPNNIDRKRLNQKMLERWENEGGKIETEPKVHLGNNTSRNPVKKAARISPSSKSPDRTLVPPKVKRKSR